MAGGRDQLIEYFGQHIESSWDLVRHRVVADQMFKVGDAPGIILFLEVDTSGEAERWPRRWRWSSTYCLASSSIR